MEAPLIEIVARGSRGIARGPAGTIELTAREVRLVQLLAARRAQEVDPEWAYVASHELAGALGFKSIEPSGENVRELVCRVRRKLASVGGDGVVQSKPHVGYRIAALVRAA
ncbi:MAG TPA: helix-turn-helix domain-containing protein [Kofleriaceae bacterium]|nr:helix-turn-helix domain-containing protein [Kofleriaceae bacterium]